MPEVKEIVIPFPVGGIVQNRGYHDQPEGTTPDAKNIWPFQWESGRGRGGVRPGRSEEIGPDGDVRGWCNANYYSGGTKTGIACATSSGCWYHEDGFDDGVGSDWIEKIETACLSDFGSCAVFDGRLIQTSLTNTYPLWVLLDTPGPGTAINDADSPENCGLVAVWNGRVFLAGVSIAPNTLYASKVGSFHQANDWDTTETGAGAAYSNAGDDVGQISEPITSLIPHNRDCFLVGCVDSIYVIRGNPKSGGQIYRLSDESGPVMNTAWCKDSADNTWILTRQGLSRIPSGCGQPPESVSKSVIPNELVGLDPGVSNAKYSLVYEDRFQGIHIIGWTGSEPLAWFYDLQAGGFWRQEYAQSGSSANQVQVGWDFPSVSSTSRGSCVLANFGTDCWIMDTSDDTEEIDSYLWLGPIPVGEPNQQGIMHSIMATLAEESGDIAWSVYIADSAQEAFNQDVDPGVTVAPDFTGENWDRGGLNFEQYPRLRGSVFYLKLEDVSNSTWSIEEITTKITALSKRRVEE